MNQENSKKKRVFVALSGGVDSSVSAALLKDAGYDVTGVFIEVWQPDFLVCTAGDDRLDAMRVCANLGVPFRTLNLADAYKREVVDYMTRSYKIGETPNPDAMCNKAIKFGAFFDYAIGEGADYVATGHYAQIKKDTEGHAHLHESIDKAKDQSYFLWMLPEVALSKTFFPVGGFTKTHVRHLAKDFKLPTAEKKDSQGLCFMGKVDIREFLTHFISPQKGAVLSEEGKTIGSHGGAVYVTVGQRHGFTAPANTPHASPYYIVAKDVPQNTITVSHSPLDAKVPYHKTTIRLSPTNWILKTPLAGKYHARLRYHGERISCALSFESKEAVVHLEKPQIFAEGQSLVLYKGKECLGGGVIRYMSLQ